MKLLFCIVSSFLATTFTVVKSYGVSSPYEVFHLPPRNGPAAGTGNRTAGPVCATNGKNYILFEDESLLSEYNYAKLRPGEYPFRKATAVHCYNACKHIKCTSRYAPLCVSAENSMLRETMSNECELDRRFCLTQTPLIILYDGPCISSCPSGCSKNYVPVCAQSNSKKLTFANICKLKCFVHESKQKWTVIHEGPCNTQTYVYEKKNPKETSAIGRANIYGRPYTAQPSRGVYEEAPLKAIPHVQSEYGPRHFPSSSSLSQKYSSDELLTLLLDALKSSSGKESPSIESGSSKKPGKITTTTHAPTTIEAETPFDRRIENLLKRYLDSIEKSSDIIIRNVTEMLNNTSLKAEAKKLFKKLVLDWNNRGLPIPNHEPRNIGTKNDSMVLSTPTSVEKHNCCRLIELIVNIVKKGLNFNNNATDSVEWLDDDDSGEWFDDDDIVHPEDSLETDLEVDATTTNPLASLEGIEKPLKALWPLIKKGVPFLHRIIFRPNSGN